MQRRGTAVGAVAMTTAILVIPGTAPADPATPGSLAPCAGAGVVPTTPETKREARAAVVCLVNQQRVARHRVPLRLSELLARSARRHTWDMRRHSFFAHVSFNGRDLGQRVRPTGFFRHHRWCILGETLAWGVGTSATPAAMVDGLMRSTTHRRILLDRRFRQIGSGMALGTPPPAPPGPGATLALNLGRC